MSGSLRCLLICSGTVAAHLARPFLATSPVSAEKVVTTNLGTLGEAYSIAQGIKRLGAGDGNLFLLPACCSLAAASGIARDSRVNRREGSGRQRETE